MKKKLNILLIAVVVGLWGYIGYRVVKNLKQETIEEYQVNNYKSESLNIERDTFALAPLERDPFLNKALAFERPIQVKTNYKPAKPSKDPIYKEKKVNVTVPWPQIEYYGYIKSGKSAELAVLKINSRLIKLHNGEAGEGIVIKKIYKDSVTVLFNSQSKTFSNVK